MLVPQITVNSSTHPFTTNAQRVRMTSQQSLQSIGLNQANGDLEQIFVSNGAFTFKAINSPLTSCFPSIGGALGSVLFFEYVDIFFKCQKFYFDCNAQPFLAGANKATMSLRHASILQGGILTARPYSDPT